MRASIGGVAGTKLAKSIDRDCLATHLKEWSNRLWSNVEKAVILKAKGMR